MSPTLADICDLSDPFAALYSATRVPLLNMMTQSKFMGLNEYTCTNADTGLQVFHAMDTATFGMELTIIFKNAAGNMEPIRLQYKIDTVSGEIHIIIIKERGKLHLTSTFSLFDTLLLLAYLDF